MNGRLKQCSVCKKSFPIHKLHPNALIRDNLFDYIQKVHPSITRHDYSCVDDLRILNAHYYEEVLVKEKGVLTALEREVIDSLRQQELITENSNIQYEEQITLGDRLADKIARFGGSWYFLGSFAFILLVWMAINTIALIKQEFDPYPFILLNLVLSCLAAIQAPIILMSQNRQAARDRVKTDQDYLVNLKAELQIRQLNSRFDLFTKHYWQMMTEFQKSQTELNEILSSKQPNNRSK